MPGQRPVLLVRTRHPHGVTLTRSTDNSRRRRTPPGTKLQLNNNCHRSNTQRTSDSLHELWPSVRRPRDRHRAVAMNDEHKGGKKPFSKNILWGRAAGSKAGRRPHPRRKDSSWAVFGAVVDVHCYSRTGTLTYIWSHRASSSPAEPGSYSLNERCPDSGI
jgi:hypothetical protein